MTLTLQDAQHASWKIFRKISYKLDAERSRSWNPYATATDLIEEVEKVAATVKGLEESKSSDKPQNKETLTRELNDLLYHVFILAEHYGIDLEESFLEHVSDNLLKFLT